MLDRAFLRVRVSSVGTGIFYTDCLVDVILQLQRKAEQNPLCLYL